MNENLGFYQGVAHVMERLDGSAKHQDLTTLIGTVSAGDMSGKKPVRTHIKRSSIFTHPLTVTTAAADNELIKTYQAAPNSTNLDAMVAGRHYAEAKYNSTVATPRVFKDRAFFDDWSEMTNTFTEHNDKLVSIVQNITVTKNIEFLNAIKATSVKRTTDLDSDDAPEYADIALPQSQRYVVADSQETLSYRDMALINARTARMNGAQKIMFISREQDAVFKDANKQFFLNKDFVSSGDLRALNESVVFQGVTPVIVEEMYDQNDGLVFGIDESEIYEFNRSAFTKVPWYDIQRAGQNTQADMRYEFLRKVCETYVRTSDLGVMHITIPRLAPSLTVNNGTATISKTSAAFNSLEVAVAVNDNRVKAQTWTVEKPANATWLTVQNGTGTGSGTFALSATANTGSGAASRSAALTVRTVTMAGTITKTITVTQAA